MIGTLRFAGSMTLVQLLYCTAFAAQGQIHPLPEEVDTTAAKRVRVSPYLAGRFDMFHYEYTGGPYDHEKFAGALYKPSKLQKDANYPLIVCLHGVGQEELETHTDLGQLRWLERTVFRQGIEDHDFYVLTMKLKADYSGWFDPSETDEPHDSITVLHSLIQKIVRKHQVDSDRISLFGISAGGTAALRMVARYPHTYSSVAPTGAGGLPAGALTDGLLSIPIWAFHSRDDKYVLKDGIVRTINKINSAGGNAHLTLVDGEGGHQMAWIVAFEEYGILKWLISQHRTRFSWPPGVRPWPPLQVWGLIGFVALVSSAIFLHFRRRRHNPEVNSLDPDLSC